MFEACTTTHNTIRTAAAPLPSLEHLAAARRLSLAALVTEIDLARGERNLASACRLAALAHLQAQIPDGGA